MIRFLLAGILFAVSAGVGRAAEHGELDASQSLFDVLAAINVAGFDADLQSPSNSPVREEVRRDLAAKNIPCLDDLKRFFAEHRQKDWTAELSQYVSYALVVDGPPAFDYRLKQNELPPDVVALSGLTPLMVRFHREAGLDSLWAKVQPALEEAIGRYHAPVTQAVTEVNAYLRNINSPAAGRFQVYVDLLGPPNQIQSRSYANEYFVVLTASPDPQVEDVRHAYLHFLLDPMATRYSEELLAKKALGDYALAAPFLEDYYKSDFLLLAGESVIKAVESRLLHGPAQARQAYVDQALSEGYILTPHFAEQLPAYEKQERAMRFYYPEMIKAIDLKREEKRLANYEFAQQRPVRKAKVVPAERKVEPTGFQKTLEDAEQAYLKRDLAAAKEGYARVLQQTSEKQWHARACYGLARIAALERDPELAEKLFQKTLESTPDPQTKAWSLVYLGRLAEIAGERETASEHYRAALAVEGSSAGARRAAEKGLQQSFKKD